MAAKQTGNISRAQLLRVGLDDGGIAWRVKIGRLHRVFRGVYSVGRPPLTPLEWASAAVLAAGAGAALSHSSAMALWGYWRRWERPYEVTVVGDRRTKLIVVHRSTTLTRHDVTKQLGIRVTTPARTVLDMSPRFGDGSLKRNVNNALHSLLFPAERVIVELDSHEFHQGRIAFETDRERDAETLAHRYVTIRMTWERMHETPRREADRLHAILANQRAIHAPSAA